MRSLLNILIAFLLLELHGCGPKDPGCTATDYQTSNIPSDGDNCVPYTGYDTLYFLNSLGDTCIVRGTGRQYFYEDVDDQKIPGCPPGKTTHYQGFSLDFVPIKGDLRFSIEVSSSKYTLEISKVNLFTYNYSFVITYSEIGNTPKHKDDMYFDSLEIANVYYKVIDRIPTKFNGFNSDDTSKVVLVNKPFGILYIADKTNSKEYSFIKH